MKFRPGALIPELYPLGLQIEIVGQGIVVRVGRGPDDLPPPRRRPLRVLPGSRLEVKRPDLGRQVVLSEGEGHRPHHRGVASSVTIFVGFTRPFPVDLPSSGGGCPHYG